ncbi:MAG TPA: hypothetical protein VF604_05620 [Pyrinomonadaceae bacterium]|jgi:hypothetical protein
MKKLHVHLGLFFLFISIISPDYAKAQKAVSISVSGRVVSERGEPVANALASLLYPPCKDCIDHIIPAYKTGKEGVFFLSGNFIGLRYITVFIEEVPEVFWNPIFPASLKLTSLPAYRGIKIKIPPSGIIRLGEVTPTIKYAKVSVNLLKEFGSENNLLSTNVLDTLKLTVKRGKQTIVKDIAIPPQALNNSIVNLALPKGNWKLLFTISERGSKKQKEIYVKAD